MGLHLMPSGSSDNGTATEALTKAETALTTAEVADEKA